MDLEVFITEGLGDASYLLASNGDPWGIDADAVGGIALSASRIIIAQLLRGLRSRPREATADPFSSGSPSHFVAGRRAASHYKSGESDTHSTTSVPTIPASAWPDTVQTYLYSPGRSMANRSVVVWPGRAPASTFAIPSTSQSWKIKSRFVNLTTVHWPARMWISVASNLISRPTTVTCCADASIARSAA
jgi:hypothetical protein